MLSILNILTTLVMFEVIMHQEKVENEAADD